MLSTINHLEAQDWPSRLTEAGKELAKVCRSAHILPLSLLQHAKTRACSGGSLISQYKSMLNDLHLPQGAMGVVWNHTVQPPAQIITSMNSFSSKDRISFLPWKKEVLTIMRHSGMPKESWAKVLLQHVLPPALH